MFQEFVKKIDKQDLGPLGVEELPTAGIFLAQHHNKLGQYYENSNENIWPHYPLHMDPSYLEEEFNSYMIKLTEAMPNSKLKNISILDLPAFGSKLEKLTKGHKSNPTWPIETNFEIHQQANGNDSSMFIEYKKLLDLWGKYMERIEKNDSSAIFPPNMQNNTVI